MHTAAPADEFFSPSSTDPHHYSLHVSVCERKNNLKCKLILFARETTGATEMQVSWSPFPAWRCPAKHTDTLSCGRVVQIEGSASAWCLQIISQQSLATALNQQITSESFPSRPKSLCFTCSDWAISVSGRQHESIWKRPSVWHFQTVPTWAMPSCRVLIWCDAPSFMTVMGIFMTDYVLFI